MPSRSDFCSRNDCFAWATRYKKQFCRALQDTDFKGKPCPFHKTCKQYLDDLARSGSDVVYANAQERIFREKELKEMRLRTQ